MQTLDEKLPVVGIIGSPVTVLSLQEQVQAIMKWTTLSDSNRYVCVVNTQMLVEAHFVTSFLNILQSADLVVPESGPIVWTMKFLGLQSQNQIVGMDLFLHLCKQASEQLIPVFFVGSQRPILEHIRSRLSLDFPKLEVAGMEPLPFSGLTRDEDEALIEQINESGAKLVFVSLGCPKQEYWMASHKHKINAVMIGVGGVFPVYAGIKKFVPKVYRETGLEWLYKLSRLWREYSNNTLIFLLLVIQQFCSESSTAFMSSYSEKTKQELPEEWIADLESLKMRLLKLDTPEQKVKIKNFFALLSMLFAKI